MAEDVDRHGERMQTYSTIPSFTLQRTDMAPTRLPMSPNALRLEACAALVLRAPIPAATGKIQTEAHVSQLHLHCNA
jgi:hypothetical protein